VALLLKGRSPSGFNAKPITTTTIIAARMKFLAMDLTSALLIGLAVLCARCDAQAVRRWEGCQ